MHEWALAESVVMTIVTEAEKERFKQVHKVNLRVGELQQIEQDVFKFALENFIASLQKPLLSFKDIKIEVEKAVLKCRACGNEWLFASQVEELEENKCEAIHFVPDVVHVYMKCSACGSPDFEIIRGRGIWIDSIEGEK